MNPQKIAFELGAALVGLIALVSILLFSKLARTMLIEAIKNPGKPSRLEVGSHEEARAGTA